VAKGVHITHWSSQDLARQVITEGIVPAISAATIRRILHEVDLQPHRTRYWKTARWDAEFKQQDGDPSHTAGNTQNYLANANTWWRPRFTPVHASWLNQAET
jgi:hypothetical protein